MTANNNLALSFIGTTPLHILEPTGDTQLFQRSFFHVPTTLFLAI